MKSKKLHFIVFIFVLITNPAFCKASSFYQTIIGGIQRNENETTEQFVDRMKPENSALTHSVINIKWNSSPAIIAFYDQIYKLPKKQDPEQTAYHKITATLFVETKSNTYNKITIDTFDSEGGDPKIETVLFANADKDTAKEMIIIVSWEQAHYDLSGTLYATFVYDDLSNKTNDKLYYLKDVSEKLEGGCECNNEKAKFKTAADVKAGLSKLGY